MGGWLCLIKGPLAGAWVEILEGGLYEKPESWGLGSR